VNGLNEIVVTAARPECTVVQVKPPSGDLSNEPFALPAINALSFVGSTAKAKTGDWPCCGSAGRATQVESGRVAANAPELAIRPPNTAASVAARRRLESDTSLPIIAA
jgi:hypothetical protein